MGGGEGECTEASFPKTGNSNSNSNSERSRPPGLLSSSSDGREVVHDNKRPVIAHVGFEVYPL